MEKAVKIIVLFAKTITIFFYFIFFKSLLKSGLEENLQLLCVHTRTTTLLRIHHTHKETYWE